MTSSDAWPEGAAATATGPSPAVSAELADTTARLLALVDTLPPAQREVVRLRFQADLSYKEIADVTAKTVSHVGVLLHEAMVTLRRQARAEGFISRRA